MYLTIEKQDKGDTYMECFDYLEKKFESHYLLTQSERDECTEAVGKLKRVFSKFYPRG